MSLYPHGTVPVRYRTHKNKFVVHKGKLDHHRNPVVPVSSKPPPFSLLDASCADSSALAPRPPAVGHRG